MLAACSGYEIYALHVRFESKLSPENILFHWSILCLNLQSVTCGTAVTNQNSIQKEIKSRLKLGNACYYSVQNLLSSRLLSTNLKFKIYRTIILPVVLYGCETWSLTLREERRLRVFGRIFGPRRDGVTGE